MKFNPGKPLQCEEYPIDYYKNILSYLIKNYENKYWMAIPSDMTKFWKESIKKN